MNDNSKAIKVDFTLLIPEYEDNKIIDILKKRKLYQPEAAELAIKEAIKRGIINSEQDLFAEEFNTAAVKQNLFPKIDDDKLKGKLRRSLSRTLLLAGILPTVWGVIIANQGNLPEGGIISFYGGIWIYLCAMLLRKYQDKFVNGLFILLLISGIYIIKIFVTELSFSFMDVFIPIILIGLILYGLIFLRRLKP